MSDVDLVMAAFARVRDACAIRGLVDEETGARVTGNQARILAHLDRDDPVMVGELADYMGVTASTMSLTLRRLREAGLVVTERDPADRRVVNVLLTEAGERLRALGDGLDPGRVDALLRGMPPAARESAVRGLAALAEAAEALVSGRGRT